MRRGALTALTVRRLKPPPAGKRLERYDALLPGLGVRITPEGARSWIYVYTSPTLGRRRRFTIGAVEFTNPDGEFSFDLEGARARAIELRRAVKAGLDPADARKDQRAATLAEAGEAATRTFAAVAGAYCEREVPRLRRGREIEATIKRELLPAWGDRQIDAITSIDVQIVVERLVEAGKPESGRKLFEIIRRIFRWAMARPALRLDRSPADRMRPLELIGPKTKRARVLADDELRSMWRATEKIGFPFGHAVQMLMLTGLRRNEVCEAQWSEFDLPARLWTIPRERMKGGGAHVIPLTSDTLDILDALPRFVGHSYLFPARNEDSQGPAPISGFSKLKLKLDRLMAAELGRPVQSFVLHDVRRSVRTRLSALPIAENVRELILAHAQPGMHAVYDLHSYEAEKREALTLWNARLRSIVDPPSGNVVTLLPVDNSGRAA